jgi:hypothetical protein
VVEAAGIEFTVFLPQRHPLSRTVHLARLFAKVFPLAKRRVPCRGVTNNARAMPNSWGDWRHLIRFPDGFNSTCRM